MAWSWHWSVFLTALPILVTFVAVARVATNQSAIEDFGPSADFMDALRVRPMAVAAGTFAAAAIYATGLTLIAGWA